MTPGQVKNQAQQTQPSKRMSGTHPPGVTRGHLGPSWDTDLGCSTDFFYLHHRCSCSPGPPPPPPRRVVCRGASPTPPPPAKRAAPTV